MHVPSLASLHPRLRTSLERTGGHTCRFLLSTRYSPLDIGSCVQVVTFVVWAAARYLLYASYFTIIGALFTYKHFGRVVALISTVTSLVGLTQLGFTHVALNTLDRRFLPIDIAAAVWVTLLYIPACAMYRLERTE